MTDQHASSAATASPETETIYVEDGERVYPCRCGETHRGMYASVDFDHHNCFHNGPIHELDPDDPGHFLCGQCGKSFFTEPRYSL